MSIPLAISQLIETEQSKQSGTLSPNSTLAIALSRIGGGDNHQRIISGTLTELSQQPPEIFGEPLHSLVIVGKRLHHLEVDYALDFAVNKGNWKKVAKEVYGCVLDDD
jgi:diphthine synthase